MSEQSLRQYFKSLKFPINYEIPTLEQFIDAHQSSKAPTSIRIHPIKSALTQLEILRSAHLSPHLQYAYTLPERPAFIKDPLWHAGAYYVQEANSMLIGQVIKSIKSAHDGPLRILDLCAAPGGKSTDITSQLSHEDLLISNEIHPQRADILYENACKWGYDNIWVTNNAPEDFSNIKNYFDVIVIDAPCSGSGMWRKDPDTINEWSTQNVATCQSRQKNILDNILPSLKEDGILIYSTCSYSQEENEDIVDYLAENYGAENYPWDKNAIEKYHISHSPVRHLECYRRSPWDSNGEGFFFTVLTIDQENRKSTGVKNKRISPVARPDAFPELKDKILLTTADNSYYLIDSAHELDKLIMSDQKKLRFKKIGTQLGSILKKQWNPDHEWALSVLNIDSKNLSCSVDKETALDYLRRENISLDTDKTGWMLVTYEHLHLGWVKSLGNRFNNYYPKNWRIRYV